MFKLLLFLLMLGNGYVVFANSVQNTLVIYVDGFAAIPKYSEQELSSIGARSAKLLLDNLPMTIDYRYASIKKSRQMLASGEEACILNRIETKERAQHYLFSKPINLYYSPKLYHLKEQDYDLASLTKNSGRLALSDVFRNNPNALMLLTGNVSHGKKLDSVLSTIPKHNKKSLSYHRVYQKIIYMLKHKKADFVLSYPQVIARKEFAQLDFVGHNIQGIAPYVLGRIMCQKSADMVGGMAIINQTLDELYHSNALFDVHVDRLHPGDVAQFKRDYREAFK